MRRGWQTLLSLLPCVLGSLAAGIPWNQAELMRAPKWRPAPEMREVGVRGLFFDGLLWQGRPTRVFAWYGVPEHKVNQKLPAMVLVHGGGGTAYAEWVRMWMKRGYAAIAVDTCGSVPRKGKTENPWALDRPRHEWAGPDGWGDFNNVELAPEEQWTYHAVADVILAHSLLRSMPEVDPNKTGLTGISWGGYLTSIAASIDGRFRFAAPVYGCGFLGEESAWVTVFDKMGPEKARRWLGLWDPSRYLGRARVPLLWVSGTNDTHYPLASLQKSYRLPAAPRTLVIRVLMPHGHREGAKPEEIFAMADALMKGGTPLIKIISQRLLGRELRAAYRAKTPVARAELNYTLDGGPWRERKWETIPARAHSARREVSVQVPEGATACFLNLVDSRGLVVSTEHVVLK